MEAERVAIGFQQGVGLVAVMLLHLPQLDDRAHRLDVEAGRLGFGIDVLDIVGDAFLLFLQPLDALDEKAELFGGNLIGQ